MSRPVRAPTGCLPHATSAGSSHSSNHSTPPWLTTRPAQEQAGSFLICLRELLTLPPGSGVKLRDGKALTVGTPHGETSPDQRACQRHTTVHQTGQKTGHSAYEQAVSYSEIPLQSSASRKTAISPSRNPAHHFRRLFDDSNALFVLNSVHTFGYNGTYPNKHSYSDAFTNRSENRSEKRPGIRS